MMNRKVCTLLIMAMMALTVVAASRKKENILTLKESITDDDIQFPASFDTDTHELMKNWYLQNYAILDADVESRSVGETSDEVYIKRLKAMPTIIEMPYNKVVRSYIDRYVKRSRTLVEQMLGMSLYYMPIFEAALEKEGMPMELKYLPVIESALNPDAVSPAGAAGLWQFMVGTGKGMGLEVNSLVDERRDPYRSSEKAALYLKDLYRIYNDWSLAIAAYNCGPGNVNKALHRSGKENADFWDIYNYLPRETRGYVPAFIAANYVMTYYKYHNISPSLARKPLITDTVTVDRRITFSQLANVLNIPASELAALNPQFRQGVIPGNNHPYRLTLPAQQVYSYILSEDSIANYHKEAFAQRDVVEPGGRSMTAGEYTAQRSGYYSGDTQTHTVGRGETMSSIASAYNITSEQLMAMNDLTSSRVRRGQRLKVPASSSYAGSADEADDMVAQQFDSDDTDRPAVTTEEDRKREEEQYAEVKKVQKEASTKPPYKGSYTVDVSDYSQRSSRKKQETTHSVTPSRPVSVSSSSSSSSAPASAVSKSRTRTAKQKEAEPEPKKTSRTTTATAKPTQKAVPQPKKSRTAKQPAAAVPPKPTEHEVKKGESLTKIAEQNGVSVSELKKANNIKGDGDMIKAGDNIKIPAKTGKSAAKSTDKQAAATMTKKSSSKQAAATTTKKSTGKQAAASTGKKSSGKQAAATSSGKKSSGKKSSGKQAAATTGKSKKSSRSK